MTLRRLQVSDLRCLQAAELTLDSRYTLISGPNASGKTSLLESIYVLGRGRSFRTRQAEKLVRAGAERFVVFGEIEASGRKIAVGVEGSADGVRARMSGDRVTSLAHLAAVLPAQIIDPEVHRLIEEGPARRRRYLDWGVFHVEHRFVEHWRGYQQVLKQRNAALRRRQARAVVTAWDAELLRLGDLIHGARSRYVSAIRPHAQAACRTLLQAELQIDYRPGWSADRTLGEALLLSRATEDESGTTQVGPHRADLAIRLNGTAVKDRISRGQQKLLAAALLIAQLRLFPPGAEIEPCLLLDDPAAELDSDNLAGMIDEVSRNTAQLFVTSLNPNFAALGSPGARYLIEGGVVRCV